jgi:hypothetical protein
MLVKKGYLKKEVGLYATLESLLGGSFFPQGIPTDDFSNVLRAQMRQGRNDPKSLRQRQALSRDMTTDTHQLLNPNLNRFFRDKSALMTYYDADFVPEKIPDSAVRIPSMLYAMRLINTEKVIDPTTGKKRLKETELVKRAKTQGQTDTELLQAASIPILDSDVGDKDREAIMRRIAKKEDLKTGPQLIPYLLSKEKKRTHWQGRTLLATLRPDLFADVCGNIPISGLNYVFITFHMMVLFSMIEDRFREARNQI